MLHQHRRELSVAAAIAALALALAVTTPAYFSPANLNDLWLANIAVLVVALGETLVILSGDIDISVGSVFAISSVAAGLIAQLGLPVPVVVAASIAVGALLGAVNGSLVGFAGIPSIVVTLATMIGLRDGLRWATQGAWVENLPASFQWLGLTQASYPIVVGALVVVLVVLMSWTMRSTALGRAVYATGSNRGAARLVGLNPPRVTFAVYAIAGAMTGLAAVLNAARFNQVPSNGGLGLEMKVIAATVVGGTAITGGRGTIAGTVLGVALLGAIGPALTFVGVSAYWERALQGAIILAAVAVDALRARPALSAPARRPATSGV